MPRHLTHPAAGAAAAPDPQRIQDDIAHLNRDPSVAMRRWAPLSPDAWGTIEQRVRRAVSVHDDFVRIPFPRIAAISAAPIVAAIQSYKQEAAVVDARLSREVTLQEKATALSDLCDRLRRDTGVYLSAGQSVADEKVTLFCEKVPLRDVMRQLSRPFGYSWTRSGKAGEYRYELVQDLRSQLMEEELRNRDRNEALLALEREIEAFRPYLGLLPDEALARSKTATSAAEKRLFERLGSRGWGPLQMYFRLSAQDLAQLRAGRTLAFSQDPRPGEQPLPPDLARGVIQSLRNWRLVRTERGFRAHTDASDPRGMPLSAVSEVRAQIRVEMRQSELGRFTLGGTSGAFTPRGLGDGFGTFDGDPPVASGTSAAAAKPKPGRARTGQAPDPALRRRVTLEPRPSTRTVADRRAQDPPAPEPRVTSADVLEALHRATKLPIVSDYYTHLYPPTTGSVREMPLADALDRIAEAMRLRWAREDGWLQFRSVTFYDDRLKEVPNRLLDRWATARKRQEMLSLEDLVEIARLSDAQLDADAMAEGARSIYGLLEWDLAREWPLRSHIRFLGEFTPEQRQQATRPAGLAFAAMSLAQQQQYLARALPERARPLQSLDELSGAVLRVDYSQPGWFQWRPPGPEWFKWALPIVPGLEGTRAPTAPLRERTREAALAAARSVAAGTRETMLAIARKMDPRAETSALLPDMSQIAPTRLDLEIIYIPGIANRRPVHVIRTDQDLNTGTG